MFFFAKQVSLLMHLLFHYIPHTSEEADIHRTTTITGVCVSANILSDIIFHLFDQTTHKSHFLLFRLRE